MLPCHYTNTDTTSVTIPQLIQQANMLPIPQLIQPATMLLQQSQYCDT